jgi:molybdopterin molybdotransferase
VQNKKGFLTTKIRQQVWEQFIKKIKSKQEVQKIKTPEALNRVILQNIFSPEDLPPAPRSLVDGYAVRADDTTGASESIPSIVKLTGVIKMGEIPEISLKAGECVKIETGGFLPDGSDSVVMVEYTKKIQDTVEIFKQVSPGENVISAGDDIKKGAILLKAGTRIQPHHIGALLGVGITQISVSPIPDTAIIVTGDEIIPHDAPIRGGKIRDINSQLIENMLKREDFPSQTLGIFADDEEQINSAILRGLKDFDVVIITGGVSKGLHDMTASIINKLGTPGVLVHGVNIAPGKPLVLGILSDKPVVGLPGNPFSVFVCTYLFILPILRKLCGMNNIFPEPVYGYRLACDTAGREGRETWLPVRIDGNLLYPVVRESNVISSLLEAGGLIKIPSTCEGFKKGQDMELYLL